MSRTRSLLALAAAAWFVWCPVAFAVSAISVPSCHGEQQQQTMDCCQPIVPSTAPASTVALPLAAGALVTAVISPMVALPSRANATPTPVASPPAGWGRVYASVCAYLI